MQTTSEICKGNNVATAALNYRFMELLATYMYKSNPIPKLASQTLSFDSLHEEFGLTGTRFADSEFFKSEAVQIWPETEERGQDRVQENL